MTRTAAARDDDSYAPQVKVIVAGKDITSEVLPDVIDLRVTLQKDELGGFTMQLANHFEVPEAVDAKARTKDEAGNAVILRQFRHSDDKLFDVFEPITLQFGYEGRMSTVFVGEITMLQPSYPSSGVPTFTVTGTDMLNRLRRNKPGEKTSKAFHDRADWEIAEQIAKRHKLKMSADSAKKGPKHKQVMQRNLDDLAFLLYLAKRNEYECTVLLENNKPVLYFGTPRDKRDSGKVEQLRLAWGESLISFTPKMRIGSQVSKVTVRGWDSRKKDVIKYTATLKDIPKTGAKGKTAAEILEDKAGAKEERIIDRVVQSAEEAKRLAIQILIEDANEFLTGSGETIGDPLLRPQTNLELVGLGRRFDGVYYVTKTDHVYGASGYTTSFDVERMRVGEA